MFGNGMTAIFLQLRARQHFGVKGLLLCTGMRGYFFAKFGKCFAPLRAVTFGFCDLFEKFTMLVMIFFEQVEYLRHTYVSYSRSEERRVGKECISRRSRSRH